MAESEDEFVSIDMPDLRVTVDRCMGVASLRYFETDGAFARLVETVTGVQLPSPLCATYGSRHTAGDRMIAAWRSPTETVLLCDDRSIFATIKAQAIAMTDGSLVDRSGGTWIVQASGAGVVNLLARMGGQGVLPMLGQARRSRLADVPVLAVHAQPGDFMLVVDRIYAEHVFDWIRASALDPVQ